MTMDLGRISSQIADLRREFDTSFALPARTPGADLLTLLVVRSGAMTHAIRISELIRVEPCPVLIPLPAQHAAFRGLAALLGRATAVYSLCGLLGRPQGDGHERWLVVAKGGLAVAVSAIHGCIRAHAEDLQHASSDQVHPIVPLGDGHCPVIDLGALLHTLLTSASLSRNTP